MYKRTLGVVLLAGLAMSGAGAFTASNTMSQSSNVAGYGEAAASGATVTDIAYSTVSTDATKLAQVVFKSSTNLAAGVGKTAQMVLKTSTTSKTYTCSIGVWDAVASNNDITCATADSPVVADLTYTGLTVTDS
jgi:uncharacterized spore protein YtfJ